MGYIHKYLTDLSAKVIKLIRNDYQNVEQVKIYENKLIEILGLVYDFFQFGNNQNYFLQHFVIFSDELFELLLYSDNFDLILQILRILKIKFSCDLFRLSYRNRYILCFIEKFLFADKEADYLSYYEYFLRDEKFLALKKESNNFFEFKISEKPFFEESDDLKVLMTLKNNNSSNTETKTIEIKNFLKIYPNEKPSILIAEEIIKENQLENMNDINFESFVKLIYSIKYFKLQNNPKKALIHLTTAFHFFGLRDAFTWSYDTTEKYYQGYDILNKGHLVFLFAPSQCLKDENGLKHLLISFRHQNCVLNNLSSSIQDSQKKEFFIFFIKRIVEIAKEIENNYSENFEILSLTYETLIYPCFLYCTISNDDDLEIFTPLNDYVEAFFKKYYFNEQLLLDPVSYFCNRHFTTLSRSMFSILDNSCFNLNKNICYFHEQMKKIIRKILETLLISFENYEEIYQKYPKILVLEFFFEDITSLLMISNFNYNEEMNELFQGIFQRILQKLRTAKNPHAIYFYNFFLEKFYRIISDLWKENVSPEEKQAFYDIIEEICLKREIILSAQLGRLYDYWILNDLSKYTTQQELEANEQDFQNVTNYLRNKLSLDFNVHGKRSYNLMNITPWLSFNALVMNEMVRYFEWLVENVVKPDFKNFEGTLKKLSSDHQNQNIYHNYLTFMIFKARKIKSGVIYLWYNLKDIKSEMDEDIFERFNECLVEFSASPLLVGIREKLSKCAFKFSLLNMHITN